jgi:hypothetical protein
VTVSRTPDEDSRSIRTGHFPAIAKRIDLDETAALVDALAGLREDPELLRDTSCARRLVGSVRSALDEARGVDLTRPELLSSLASGRRTRRVPVEALLDSFDEVHRELALAEVPALLLKGLYFGQRLYGALDLRPQFDVDVLVQRPLLGRAVRVLRRCGFARTAYDLHSVTLVRHGVKVDLHRSLRSAPAYRLNEDEFWSRAREVVIAGRRVPTLSDEHTLVLLILSSFEDLGQGMLKLKQLLDLFLLLREVDGTSDWERFLARRERENLFAVSINLLALVLDAFEARDRLPRLDAALRPHSDRICHADREAALALIAAPRKASANLAWFARVYPGSMAHYLAWFWAGGFPDNLRQIGRPWVFESVRRALASPRARHA